MARARLAQILKAKTVANSDDVLRVVKESQGKLRALDETFKLYIALLNTMGGPQAESRTTSRVLAVLPAREKEVALLKAIQDVERLTNDSAQQLAPHIVHNSTNILLLSLHSVWRLPRHQADTDEHCASLCVRGMCELHESDCDS